MMSFAVTLRTLVLFVIAIRASARSPRVTPPGSFEYALKGESFKLIKVDDGRVSQLKDISTGVYSLKLAGTRGGGCGFKRGSDEYLGFNNRTCTSSLAPSQTAGPVMRGPSSSMMWREWLIRVQNKGEDRVDVTLQAFMHPALEDQGKCLGYVSNYYGNPEYRGSCIIPPYGNGLFLNGTEDTGNDVLNNPQVLSIKTAPSGSAAEGAFELTAANKPDVCMRALAVEDCDSQPVLVENPAEYFVESKKYKTWILTKRYGVMPKTFPPPPLSPPPPSPPPPPPPAPITGPRIEPYIYGQTVVTWGYIEVSVKSLGGNTACSVESVTFTAVNKATAASDSTPAYSVNNLQQLPLATVPLPAWNEYEVYAVGTCSDGRMTERSNVLVVTSVLSAPARNLCTFIPGDAINVDPAPQSCFKVSGHYTGLGRLNRDGTTPPPCGSTPKAYPGNLATGTSNDVVVFTSDSPVAGTCVTVTVGGGSCTSNQFLSLWAGEFPISPGATWPATGSVGGAIFQNDPGSSTSPLVVSFTMPPSFESLSIALSTVTGTSSCQYGDISISYG